MNCLKRRLLPWKSQLTLCQSKDRLHIFFAPLSFSACLNIVRKRVNILHHWKQSLQHDQLASFTGATAMPCCVPVSHFPQMSTQAVPGLEQLPPLSGTLCVRPGCLCFPWATSREDTKPFWMINSYLSRLNDLTKKLHLIDQSANLDLGQLSSAPSKRQTEYSAQHLSCLQSFFSIMNHLFRQLFPSCTTLLNRSSPSNYQWVSRETLNLNQNKLSLNTQKQFRN